MSSDFEKALARAAAERSARDEAKLDQKREHAEKLKLAHSIIDPYLAELGPQVVKTLRDLKIPTYFESSSNPYYKGATDYWIFPYDNRTFVEDSYGFFTIDTNGAFGRRSGHIGGTSISAGIISKNTVIWRDGRYAPVMWANPDDFKVYLDIYDPKSSFPFQELSDVISRYIVNVLKE